MQRLHDLVLFGATGFTGGLVAEYLAERLADSPRRWALAGRDRGRLEAVRRHLVDELANPELAELPLVVADSSDPASLRAMAADARVVLTTVGPYSVHGEPLVEACIEARTDYVDITGEPAYWQRLIDRHHDAAVERDVRVIPCCGFDSIPHDITVFHAVSQLEPVGDVRVDGYVAAFGDFSGGTWSSALHVLSGSGPMQLLRGRPARGGARTPGSRRHLLGVHYSDEVARWVTPLPTIDPLVVRRTAKLLGHAYGSSFSYAHFFEAKDKWQLAGAVLGAGGLFVASKIPAVRRRLAATRPPGTGPTEAARGRHWFRVHVVARDDREIVRAEMRGGDPGYGDTAKMVAEAALCLVEDRARIRPGGGVLTPAAALGAPLVKRLREAGMVVRRVQRAEDPRPPDRRPR